MFTGLTVPLCTPEKDSQRFQTSNVRDTTITVTIATEVKVDASAKYHSRRRGIRGEKIEGQGHAGKEETRGVSAGDWDGDWDWDWEHECVVRARSCGRRCGLRGHRVGQSAARKRGGAKVAPGLKMNEAEAEKVCFLFSGRVFFPYGPPPPLHPFLSFPLFGLRRFLPPPPPPLPPPPLQYYVPPPLPPSAATTDVSMRTRTTMMIMTMISGRWYCISL